MSTYGVSSATAPAASFPPASAATTPSKKYLFRIEAPSFVPAAGSKVEPVNGVSQDALKASAAAVVNLNNGSKKLPISARVLLPKPEGQDRASIEAIDDISAGILDASTSRYVVKPEAKPEVKPEAQKGKALNYAQRAKKQEKETQGAKPEKLEASKPIVAKKIELKKEAISLLETGVQKVAEKVSRVGLTFLPFQNKRDISNNVDQTGVSEKLQLTLKRVGGSKKLVGYKDMGNKHMFKRLEIFQALGNYMKTKKDSLKDYKIPNCVEGQYRACAYFVPSLGGKDDYQRAHISLLNKVVLQERKSGKFYEINDSIKFKGKETTLHELLNTCDYAPRLLNDIDSYWESAMRPYADSQLRDVLNGLDPLIAAKKLSSQYESSLIQLKNMLEKNEFEANNENEKNIVANRDESLIIIEGMINATKAFKSTVK